MNKYTLMNKQYTLILVWEHFSTLILQHFNILKYIKPIGIVGKKIDMTNQQHQLAHSNSLKQLASLTDTISKQQLTKKNSQICIIYNSS